MSAQGTDINWLVRTMASNIPLASSVLLLSTDGLVRASTGLGGDDADVLAAGESSLLAVAASLGQRIGAGAVLQVVVRLEHAWLCVASAGSGTCLGVIAGVDTDPGQLGFEMEKLVNALKPHLVTAPRGLTGALPASP